jgi:UDP-3-O-[3-hydroxymyristoyl] glucosamine N-acyltransferase
MTELLFFERPAGLTLADIARLTGATARGGALLDRRITSIASLDQAGPSDLAFLDRASFVDDLKATKAGICLVAPRFAEQAPPEVGVLIAAEPYRAFVEVTRTLFAGALRPSSLFEATGVTPGAHVHPSARLERDVTVDPGAVIGPHAEIGARTRVGATAVIGPRVRIGRECSIGAGSSVTHCLMGDRVIVHPGSRIGQDGFGYVMGRAGHLKVPQVGRVIIQDNVEIGAGTTIDRGANRDTVVGEGTKIDNLVQVGHNVVIGRHCILVAQTGIAGSVTVGDFVVLGARVGVNNHVTIGEGAQIAAVSVVHGDVPPGARWGGIPAKPLKVWFREMTLLEQMAARSGAATNRPRDREEMQNRDDVPRD